MPDIALISVLQALTVAGSALTAFKLYQTGLRRRYPIFFVYLVYRVPFNVLALALNHNSNLYQYFWVVTVPISWTFYVLVIRELCGLILEKYPGLKTLGRWFMYLSTAISIVVSVLSLLPRIQPATPQRSKIMFYILAGDRGITFSLAVFLLVMTLLLSRYPVRLPRNVVVHALLYTTLFLSTSLTTLLKSVFGVTMYETIDLALMGTASACGLAWFLLLNEKGEEVEVNLPRLSGEQEERLLTQLDQLNQTLLGAGKN